MKGSKLGLTLGLFAGVALLSFLLPFTYWPEMLVWPFLMSQGWLPYQDITIVHTPLLLWKIELLYRLFGPSLLTLHVLGTAFILATVGCLVFFLHRFNKRYGLALLAGALFALFSFCFQGNTVWFESALPLFLIPLWWCLARFEKTKNHRMLFLAGVFFTLAFWTKQTSLYLLPVLAMFLGHLYFFKKLPLKQILLAAFWIVVPMFLISLLFISVLLVLGVGNEFFYWAIRFVFFKPFEGGGSDSYVLLPALHQTGIIALLVAVGVVQTLRSKTFSALIACSLMIVSLLFAFPRFEYFHLIPSLAFLSLLLGLSYQSKRRSEFLLSLGIVVCLALFVGVRTHRFTHTFVEPPTLKLAKVLNDTYPNERIFSLNGPDQVYFLTGRLPAFKPWFAQLPWYFHYYTEQRYLEDFKTSQPDIIFYVPYTRVADHGVGAFVPRKLFDYIISNYHEVEVIDGVHILRKGSADEYHVN